MAHCIITMQIEATRVFQNSVHFNDPNRHIAQVISVAFVPDLANALYIIVHDGIFVSDEP